MIHQKPTVTEEWKEENVAPFNELILSWNAARPLVGKFYFYVSVKTDQWSPWLLYATWGSDGQSSYSNSAQESSVKIYQDTLDVTDNKKATAFQIKITAEGSCSLNAIHGLHVYTNGDKSSELQNTDLYKDPIFLKVPGISQMALDHIRHTDLCSPTSTTAVVNLLSENEAIDPICFAQNALDLGFDIFGNWVFNVAEASTHLGNKWVCWVERLNGFDDIYNSLKEEIPVIVSIRGPLEGSAAPYAKGHLLVVAGYDPSSQNVICMDPAFPKDSDTHVSYALSDFMQAWDRRGKVAYVFKRNKE